MERIKFLENQIKIQAKNYDSQVTDLTSKNARFWEQEKILIEENRGLKLWKQETNAQLAELNDKSVFYANQLNEANEKITGLSDANKYLIEQMESKEVTEKELRKQIVELNKTIASLTKFKKKIVDAATSS